VIRDTPFVAWSVADRVVRQSIEGESCHVEQSRVAGECVSIEAYHPSAIDLGLTEGVHVAVKVQGTGTSWFRRRRIFWGSQGV
jgi:hypothetical protein